MMKHLATKVAVDQLFTVHFGGAHYHPDLFMAGGGFNVKAWWQALDRHYCAPCRR